MPLSFSELVDVMMVDEAQCMFIRPGDIVIIGDKETLYYVCKTIIRKGSYKFICSWGEELEGPVRTHGAITKFKRIPREWLKTEQPPPIRRPDVESNQQQQQQGEKMDIPEELVLSTFRGW